jgi:predicted transcriptional regulator
MSHTQESKQNLQSDELWFSKSNYMYKYLSERSKKIIEKIKLNNGKHYR